MIQIIKNKPLPIEKSPCKPAMQAEVLEVQFENFEKSFENYKQESKENFIRLEKSFEKRLASMQDAVQKDCADIKKLVEKQEKKLDSIDNEVCDLKTSFSALFAKFGMLFSAIASLGAFGLNLIFEKLK